MDTLLNRRSIRKYSDCQIDDNTLNYILDAGIRASNCGNMQLYSIIVTKSKEMKDKLLPLHFGQSMIEDAPIVLTICADINRFHKWCKINDAQQGLDNFMFLNIATIDATICSQAMATAAESKGLGICYLGTVNYNAKEIAQVLSLPKGVVPICCITMGYPAEQSQETTERLPRQAVVHYESYKNYSDEDIKQLYKTMEENPVNQAYVKENNKQNLAQVFAEVRYAKKDNEEFSLKYKDFVNESFLSKDNQL